MIKQTSIFRGIAAVSLAGLILTPASLSGSHEDPDLIEAIAAQNVESTTQANLSRSVRQPTANGIKGLIGDNTGDYASHGALWGETDGSDSRYQADNIQALESRPEATKTIFLDFDGAILTDTIWGAEKANGTELVYPALVLEDASESDMRAVIYYTWAIVAENFAQFDVNVTTKVPEPSDIIRSSEDDTEYGLQVVFTTHELDGMEHCECAGIASMSEFGKVAPDVIPSPAFVNPNFSNDGDGGYNVKSPASAAWVLAHIATHEIGHTLGLKHDGTGDSDEYGKPIGPVSLFMGMTPGASRYARWTDGLLASTTEDFAGRMVQREDDLAILSDLLGVLPDDMPDTIFSDELSTVDDSGRIAGLLTDHNDIDVFRVYIPERSVVKVEGKPAPHNYQLATSIDVYNSDKTRLTPLTDKRRWRTKFDNGKAYYTDFSVDRHHVVVEPGWLYVRITAGSGWPHLTSVEGETYGSLGSWEAQVTTVPLDDDTYQQYLDGAPAMGLFLQASESERGSHMKDMALTKSEQ